MNGRSILVGRGRMQFELVINRRAFAPHKYAQRPSLAFALVCVFFSCCAVQPTTWMPEMKMHLSRPMRRVRGFLRGPPHHSSSFAHLCTNMRTNINSCCCALDAAAVQSVFPSVRIAFPSGAWKCIAEHAWYKSMLLCAVAGVRPLRMRAYQREQHNIGFICITMYPLLTRASQVFVCVCFLRRRGQRKRRYCRRWQSCRKYIYVEQKNAVIRFRAS